MYKYFFIFTLSASFDDILAICLSVEIYVKVVMIKIYIRYTNIRRFHSSYRKYFRLYFDAHARFAFKW